jgi:hypothetical protein
LSLDSPASRPWTEAERLAALHAYDVLDTEPEAAFDEIVALIARICDAPIAVVNLIDQGRQWFKAEVGLGVRETPLDTSFCAHALLQQDGMVVPDATADSRFACNPLVTGESHLRFYAGVLLKTSEGLPIGTLCVLDTEVRPEGLDDLQTQALTTLSHQVMSQLELRRALRLRSQSQDSADRAIAAAEYVGASWAPSIRTIWRPPRPGSARPWRPSASSKPNTASWLTAASAGCWRRAKSIPTRAPIRSASPASRWTSLPARRSNWPWPIPSRR